jgi:NADP-dependent 3-hydroxy acid dehydrogenase YdfG
VTTGETASSVDEESAPRAVVVTGASSGIGLATAERLARAGHLVVLGTSRGEICEQVAARLRDEGSSAFAAHLDLADTCSIDKFVDAARYLVGTVDVLVSNFDLDVLGAQYLAAQLIPAMIEKGSGDLVFVSPEVVGERSQPRMAAYPVAVQAWVALLQAGLEGTGVRASIARRPDDVARVVTGVIVSAPRTHLRLVEVVPSWPRTLEARN